MCNTTSTSTPGPVPAPVPNAVVTTAVTAPSSSQPTFETHEVRNDDQIKITRPQFSRTMREKLPPKEKINLTTEATSGSDKKIKRVDYSKVNLESTDANALKNNVEIESFINEFENHCVRFDMVYTLKNFPLLDDPIVSGDDSTRFRNGNTIDLIKKWDQIGDGKEISLQLIGEAIDWLKRYTSKNCESYLEDLQWVDLHLKNSMQASLRESVSSTLEHDYQPSHWGGPLTFAIMIDKCINLSEGAIDCIKEMIKRFDIKKIPGENIELVVTRFKYAFKRLENNNAITPSLVTSLFDVFQTTSVDEFNNFVSHWKNQDLLAREKDKVTYKLLMNKLHTLYNNILVKGDWNGTADTKQGGAAFITEKKSTRFPVDPSRPNFTAPIDADRISTTPLRYCREIKGKPMKFCAVCDRYKGSEKKGRWNVSHHTDEHAGPISGVPPAQANLAVPTPAPTSERTVTFEEDLLAAQSSSN